MSNINAMIQAVDFIEAHLKAEITVAAMAQAVGYSLYHFCRTFSAVCHHTPYDYLMRRRLSEAARALLASDQKIIDIAGEYQFNSPETFARAFKRMFATQPQQWRKTGRLDPHRLRSRLTLAHLEHLHQGSYLKPVVVEKAGLEIAGVMSLIGPDPAAIGQLWAMLAQELANSDRGGNFYGLAWYPPGWEQGGYFYLAGIEQGSRQVVGSALVIKELPPSTCIRFIHRGAWGDLPLTQDYIYQSWLPQSSWRLAYPLEIHSFGSTLENWAQEQAEWEIYLPVK